jgi:hypothetical protein
MFLSNNKDHKRLLYSVFVNELYLEIFSNFQYLRFIVSMRFMNEVNIFILVDIVRKLTHQFLRISNVTDIIDMIKFIEILYNP